MIVILKSRAIDSDTLEPVPFAHIYKVRNGEKIPVQTISDSEGYFQILDFDKNNENVGISSVGYGFQEFNQIAAEYKLKPNLNEINEVTISAKKKTDKKPNKWLIVVVVVIGVFAYFKLKK